MAARVATLTACLPQTTNLGLVLRWQAALCKVRAFQAVLVVRKAELIAQYYAALCAAAGAVAPTRSA